MKKLLFVFHFMYMLPLSGMEEKKIEKLSYLQALLKQPEKKKPSIKPQLKKPNQPLQKIPNTPQQNPTQEKDPTFSYRQELTGLRAIIESEKSSLFITSELFKEIGYHKNTHVLNINNYSELAISPNNALIATLHYCARNDPGFTLRIQSTDNFAQEKSYEINNNRLYPRHLRKIAFINNHDLLILWEMQSTLFDTQTGQTSIIDYPLCDDLLFFKDNYFIAENENLTGFQLCHFDPKNKKIVTENLPHFASGKPYNKFALVSSNLPIFSHKKNIFAIVDKSSDNKSEKKIMVWENNGTQDFQNTLNPYISSLPIDRKEKIRSLQLDPTDSYLAIITHKKEKKESDLHRYSYFESPPVTQEKSALYIFDFNKVIKQSPSQKAKLKLIFNKYLKENFFLTQKSLFIKDPNNEVFELPLQELLALQGEKKINLNKPAPELAFSDLPCDFDDIP
ncbi:MAG: hypothetical protein AB7R69_04525 [Candidatus Babeliales bacterium]